MATSNRAKWKIFQHPAVVQERLQVRRVIVRPPKPHQMRIAIAAAQLHQAKRVATQAQAHGLGVDGQRLGIGEDPVGQIAFVQMMGHLIS